MVLLVWPSLYPWILCAAPVSGAKYDLENHRFLIKEQVFCLNLLENTDYVLAIYIQFKAPKGDGKYVREGKLGLYFFKLLYFVLSKIIPKANPDYSDLFDKVEYWYVECDIENGFPEREIGFDATGKAIMKMPYNNNYGYWTDNNLLLADFKGLFNATEISKQNFEAQWSQHL